MIGGTDLAALLAGMRPVLHPDVVVFATVGDEAELPAGVDPVMVFREREGRTLILREVDAAAAGIPSTFPSRMITLEVHSSLEAVGFLAAITTALAAAGMGVNPVSGYFHDHLFVPADRAKDAMAGLQALARAAGAAT